MLGRALIILAAARSGRLELPEGWRETVEAAGRMLRRWEGDAPDFGLAVEVLERVAMETYALLGATPNDPA